MMSANDIATKQEERDFIAKAMRAFERKNGKVKTTPIIVAAKIRTDFNGRPLDEETAAADKEGRELAKASKKHGRDYKVKK